jgi:hypothetical protein
LVTAHLSQLPWTARRSIVKRYRLLVALVAGVVLGVLLGRASVPSASDYPTALELWGPPPAEGQSAPPPKHLKVYRAQDGGRFIDLDTAEGGRMWKVVLVSGRRVSLYAHE